jgi:putative ABC transport system ATP-binding protein
VPRPAGTSSGGAVAPPLIIAQHLVRRFDTGSDAVMAIDDVSFEIEAGEFVAVVGPSGCGKSTLLHMCGAMDRPSDGTLSLGGQPLERLADDELTRLRRTRVGFVFQFFNLLPTLTLAENVALPLLLDGKATDPALARAHSLCARVGLSHRLTHYPHQLSGGELQRGAIARALVHDPELVVADEPTGSLDSANGDAVLSLLREINSELKVTLLLATHAPDVASAATRVLHMRDGRIARVERAQRRDDPGFSSAAL